MKTTIHHLSTSLAWLLFLLSGLPEASSADLSRAVLVGISPGIPSSLASNVVTWVLRAPPTTSFEFFDLITQHRIASFEVPQLKYDSRRARLAAMGPKMQPLLLWFQHRLGNETTASVWESNVPRFSQTVQALARPDCSLVVIGSPLHREPNEPAFDMSTNRVPNAGLLLTNLIGSIYGTAGREGALLGAKVFWIIPETLVWSSEHYRQQVHQFWHCYLALQSGSLAAFSSDIDALLEMSLQASVNPTTPPRPQLKHEPPQMVVVNPRPEPEPLPLPARMPSLVPGHFRIGLIWTNVCDLDLNVWPRRGVEALCFSHTNSAEGSYARDFRRGTGASEFEVVDLEGPIDLQQVEAFVNFYDGPVLTNALTGTFFVQSEGVTRKGTFTIPCGKPDRAANKHSRTEKTSWVRLPLGDLFSSSH